MNMPPVSRSGRMFPVLSGKYAQGQGVCVPWSLVAPHEAQAEKNHSQSLERLAERGGLSACELAAVLEDRPWVRIADDAAWAAIFNAARSEKPAQEDRALNLLRGLHKVVLDLAPHFEKPITDDNVTRWLALNSAQAAVKEFLDAANR